MKGKVMEMRKFFLIGGIWLLCILGACQNKGSIQDVAVSLDESKNFSQKELAEGIDVVKKRFLEFTDCELLTLSYEEDLQREYLDKHIQYGVCKDVDPVNVLILTSSFYAGKQADVSLHKDTTYENWVWILQREDASSAWVELDHGYL